jgi:heme/copper-type cytochrome/quinol oxidase subunit 3
LGILLFIASESVVFLSVIAMYVTGQAHQSQPTAQESLDAARMIPFSIALWASSGTIALAGRRVERGDQRGVRLWLGATIVLGAIFLGGELSEWLSLFGDRITAASNVWSTAFFTLTGIHGLHVIFGLLLMLGLISFSRRYPVARGGESGFEIVSLYWHFVDAMWVLIYGVVYFWSAFLGG